MQPNQPAPPAPNPYDFITKPPQQSKKSRFNGSSMKSRLLVVLGGAFLFIIIASIIMSILSSAGSAPIESLRDLAKDQQEIARIADLGAKDANDTSTRGFAETVKLSVSTQQQKIIAYLDENGSKMSQKDLSTKQNDTIDQTLKTAASNNRFSEVFILEIKQLLANYSNKLQSTYNDTDDDTLKSILKDSYDSTNNILDPQQ